MYHCMQYALLVYIAYILYPHYREVFLHFCNSGESRVLFVQLPPADTEGLEDDEEPCVSLQPAKCRR